MCEKNAYLGLGGLFIEGETSVNFRRHTSRDDGKNLLAKLNKLPHM